MTHYSQHADSVRIDFFRPDTFTWYDSEEMKWTGAWNKETLIQDAFAQSLLDHLYRPEVNVFRMRDMVVVCLEPYHENAFPQMFLITPLIDRYYSTWKAQYDRTQR